MFVSCIILNHLRLMKPLNRHQTIPSFSVVYVKVELQHLTAGLSDVLQCGTQQFLQRNLLLFLLPAGQTVKHKPQTLIPEDTHEKGNTKREFTAKN